MRRSTVRMKVSEPTDAVINEVIRRHQDSRIATMGLYGRYEQKGLEIQSRELSKNKANNKLAHDYRGYIVNQIVGYLWGNPLAYQIDKLKYNETEYDKYADKLSNFNVINAVDDLDSEIGKVVSICGYAARLLYVDRFQELRAMNVFPWEVVFIQDGNDITHSMRYYEEKYYEDGKEKVKRTVEWYDDLTYTILEDNGSTGKYQIVDGPKEHLFSFNPLVLFQNNDEETGDFEKVESQIDAYDKNRSDAINEGESFANAYMGFKGVTIDEETMEQMKQTGGVAIDEEGDVFFITKNINDTFDENTRKNLSNDIHKFSASVDMTDEKFSGAAQTGESRKWKLIDLENKAGTKARKFGKALREQFKVLCSGWNKKEGSLNYLDIFWEFKRNLPIDIGYVGDAVSKLNGIHSKRTLLGQIPYIEDVDYELKLMDQEAEGAIDLDDIETKEDGQDNVNKVNNETSESNMVDGTNIKAIESPVRITKEV